MSSISDKARSFFDNLVVKGRNLSLSLTEISSKLPIGKPSKKQLRLEATKAYFKNKSHRREKNRLDEHGQNQEPVTSELIACSTYETSTEPSLATRMLGALTKFNENSSKWRKTGIALLGSLLVLGIAGGAIAYSQEKAIAVKVDGKQVALVRDKAAAQKILEQLKQEKTKKWKQKLMVEEKVAFTETEVRRYQINDNEELKAALNSKLTFVGVATGLKVEGQIVAVVKDADIANQALAAIKERFAGSISNMQVKSVAFQEKVEVVDIPASLKDVQEANEVVEKLVNGQEKAKIHVVAEGDSLWTIARKYDTHVADLKVANPSLQGENPKLSIGQELKLVKVEPLLTVLVEAETTVKETIPYKVKVQTDKSMWKGKQKVKEKGENGSREVTYKLVLANGSEAKKTVLNEKILKPAKDQVVVRGAKLVVASRGGGGKLAWPTGGKITSRYGRRWGSMHTGIDIDGHTGQPIGAADEGRVVSAGWDGAYGKQVTIDHGNGIKTKYAHLSSISVSVGDRVGRGELIGKMGSTGRSTGSHLHFEVKIGGSFRNPLSYLR